MQLIYNRSKGTIHIVTVTDTWNSGEDTFRQHETLLDSISVQPSGPVSAGGVRGHVRP